MRTECNMHITRKHTFVGYPPLRCIASFGIGARTLVVQRPSDRLYATEAKSLEQLKLWEQEIMF